MNRKDKTSLLKQIKGLTIVDDRIAILKIIDEAAPFINDVVFHDSRLPISGKRPKNRITVLFNKNDNMVTSIVYG